MKYGFCNLAVIPMRSEPNNISEQISQLLFGETFDVLDTKNEKCLVKTHHDSYQGWISQKQFLSLDSNDLEKLNPNNNLIITKLITTIKQIDSRNGQTADIFVIFGAILVSCNFTIGNFTFSIEQNDVAKPRLNDFSYVIDIAQSLLNAPYQWGGRSVLGIDCSGFTQLCYRFADINLYRDASQQVEQGRDVASFAKAQAGDLCFFSQSDTEKITHVGIFLKDNRIIHSSGKVRIDCLTQDGIINTDTRELTHRLLSIRTFNTNNE